MAPPSLLLLKAASSTGEGEDNPLLDDYEQLLSGLGCKVYFIPVLQFNFINIETLVEAFRQTEIFCGLVLTSPRSVEACQKAFSIIKDDQILNYWRECKPCYTVGPSTADKAKEHLMWNATQIQGGEECGSSESLAQYILRSYKSEDTANVECSSQKTLLYPCGNLKRETLAKSLKSATADVQLHDVTCYQTDAHSDLENKIQTLSEKSPCLDIVVFFSPSGVKFSWNILKRYFKSCPKCIAIGPTTMQTLRTYCKEEDCIYQSNTPSAQGIQTVVRQILKEL